MSKMEELQGLMSLALGDRPAAERLEALQAANLVRKDMKVGWAKLGFVPEGFNMADALGTLQDEAKAQAEAAALHVKDHGDTDAKQTKLAGDAEKPTTEQPLRYNDPATEDNTGIVPADEPPAKTERGGIGRLVNELLVDTDDDYATIVAKVVARFPEAKTTARSVASVAADLRRDGVDVKTRRKAKKPAAAAPAV